MIRFLLWLGLVSRDPSTLKLVWPVAFAPAHIFRNWRTFVGYCRFWGPVYVFRNRPGVVKWIPGRLLPRRWGFGVFGLIEIGDRGVR